MDIIESERWFEIEAPTAEIASIVIGTELGGIRIYIYGVDPARDFEGADSIQDDLEAVIMILRQYVSSESIWCDYNTRQVVHVWDALCALSDFEQ